MSIQVSHLSKQYQSQWAVKSLNFEVKTGEIVGFLGPNGAGKSTTMKMITGFLKPTEGQVTVMGFDPQLEPLLVKQKIGYLAENNPLYMDMYVREFLSFVANVHQIPKAIITTKINQIIERIGLCVEQNKKIGQLSKGYKQRVGLAQALIHDPQVLILDEPTSGLDPNQLVEIRRIIKEEGSTKSVLFSSHIMQEIEAICDRIIIINKGQLVAEGTIAQIKQKGNNLEDIFKSFTQQ